MAITAIELIGFERMSLTGIQRIKITFTERLQLILGMNGAGKTALCRELTPLPAHKSNYADHGSKTIWKEHNGHSYVMKSTMSPMRHSFKKDGQELNPGGTQSVQRELVLQEFGLTPEIHNLMTGKERFTRMNSQRRREWFTMLSEVSYDYALSRFKMLRDRQRKLNGAIDLAKKRLVVESAKLISDEERFKLDMEIDELQLYLEILQNERTPFTSSMQSLQEREYHLTNELRSLEKRLISLRSIVFGRVPYQSMDEIDDRLYQIRGDLSAQRALMDKTVKEHTELERHLEILRQAGEKGITELQERAQRLSSESEALVSQLALPRFEIEPQAGLAALGGVWDTLSDIFSTIPSNEEQRFSQEAFRLATEKRVALINEKHKLENQYNHLLGDLKVMESHKALGGTKCPKCGHSWIQGYSDTEHGKLLRKKEELEEAFKRHQKEEDANTGELQAIDAYRIQYGVFTRTIRNVPVLQPFWDHLLASRYVLNAPKMAQVLMEQLTHDLQLELNIKRIQAEWTQTQTLITKAKDVEGENVGQISGKLKESDEALEGYAGRINALTQEQTSLVQLKQSLKEYLDLGEQLRSVMGSLERVGLDQIESMRRDMVLDVIRRVQVDLATKTKLISEVALQQRTCSDLKANIEEMEIQETVVKDLIRELSPTDGLIADGLFGSIQSFVGEMNVIISKIWSYPLVVKPCGVSTEEGSELDYQFPMVVNGKIVDDVGDGSTGQAELIDLAFRLVAKRRLKLDDVPLVLDEFGSGFDDTHRKSAAGVIQGLINQQLFSQVFMVSHYEASYGSLTQTEVLVLGTDNVVLPAHGKYNQHAEIER